jgi:hypothetical protein
MENPQSQTNVQITTVDAISLLYYASISVAPQPQSVLENLKNEAIKTYVHLITENERLTAEVAKLQEKHENANPVVHDIIECD